MRLHGRLGDDERGGDLGVREAAPEQREHLDLARRERVERGRAHRGAQALGEPLEQPARHLRGEQGVAARDDADGLGELHAARVLQEEAARAGGDRVRHVLVEIEGGDDQDARRGVERDELPRRADAVEHRHADVAAG